MMFGNDLLPEIYRKLSELLVLFIFFIQHFFFVVHFLHTQGGPKRERRVSFSFQVTGVWPFSRWQKDKRHRSLDFALGWQCEREEKKLKNFPTENIWQTWRPQKLTTLIFLGLELIESRSERDKRSELVWAPSRKCLFDEINYFAELIH